MNVEIMNRIVDVKLSDRAQKKLQKEKSLLFADMELFFSCMIRKRLVFSGEIPERAVQVADNLYLGFHPVMTKGCSLNSVDGSPPLTDFPIKKPEGFIPHWVYIDFRDKKWTGEFGYV